MAVLSEGRAEAVWVGSCGVVVSGGRPCHHSDGCDVSSMALSVARGSVAVGHSTHQSASLLAARVCAWSVWGACGMGCMWVHWQGSKRAGPALWPVMYMSDRIKGHPQAGGLHHVVATYEGQDLVSIECRVGFYVVW